MGKNKIILGTSASNIYMRGKYESIDETFTPITTAFVFNNINGMEIGNKILTYIDFSPEELEECCKFINRKKFHETIGFNDGTALYYAAKNALPFLVTDNILGKTCKDLGIQYISDSNFIATTIINPCEISTNPNELGSRRNFAYIKNKLMTG